MISKETAQALAVTHAEIESAEKLLAEITTKLAAREQPDFRDAFGRPAGGLQLGVPTGDAARRMFHVDWWLARPVIEAAIAQKRSQILALNEKARAELGTR